MVFPSERIETHIRIKLRKIVEQIAKELNITGAFNIQALRRDKRLAVIETNLRASRSLPFVSKVLGVDFAAVATLAILGKPPAYNKMCDAEPAHLGRVGVKVPEFSFRRLPGADPMLGVEMRSTGEVASLDTHRSHAYLKALMAAGLRLPPHNSTAWITLPAGSKVRRKKSVKIHEQPEVFRMVRQLVDLGITIACSAADADEIRFLHTVPVALDLKGKKSLTIVKAFTDHNVQIVFDLNGQDSEYLLRRSAIDFDIPLITNYRQFVMLVESLHATEEHSHHSHEGDTHGKGSLRAAESLNDYLSIRNRGFQFYIESPEDRGVGMYATKPKDHLTPGDQLGGEQWQKKNIYDEPKIFHRRHEL